MDRAPAAAGGLADWLAERAGGLERKRTCLVVGGEVWRRTYLVHGWPSAVSPEWLRPLVAEPLPEGCSLRVALRYEPAEIDWNWATNMRVRRLERSVQSAAESGSPPSPEEVRALESIRALQRKTLYEGAGVFDVWCLLSVSAPSPEALETACSRLEKVCRNLRLAVSRLPYEQTEAFKAGWIAGLPDGEFFRRHPGRLADEDSAAALYPFTYGTLDDGTGICVGRRAAGAGDGSFAFLDLERDPEGNKNFVVLGASGEGKSTFMKALLTSLLLEGYQCFVFDVDGEYRPLCEFAGGLWIDHTMASGRYVDPLRVPPPLGDPGEDAARLDHMLNAVMRAASLLAGGLSPAEANAADRALTRLWEAAGVDREDQATWPRLNVFTIHRWHAELKALAAEGFPGAAPLADKLWRFFEGAQSRMFAVPDDPDFGGNPLAVFHVAQTVNNELEEHAAAVKMSLALTSVWDAVRRNRVRADRWSAVFCDEGQRLLLDPNASRFVNTLATTIRKWNGMLVLATNKPSVLWAHGKGGTEGGSGLWSNSAYKVLFWLEEADMRAVEENAELPAPVLDLIRGLRRTHRFVFRALDKGFDVLRLDLPPEELALYRTRGLAEERR
jgi:hypothetical protein